MPVIAREPIEVTASSSRPKGKRDVSAMLGEAAEMQTLWERQRRLQREKR